MEVIQDLQAELDDAMAELRAHLASWPDAFAMAAGGVIAALDRHQVATDRRPSDLVRA